MTCIFFLWLCILSSIAPRHIPRLCKNLPGNKSHSDFDSDSEFNKDKSDEVLSTYSGSSFVLMKAARWCWEAKLLNFPAVNISGTATEPDNFWWSARITWRAIQLLRCVAFSLFLDYYWPKWFKYDSETRHFSGVVTFKTTDPQFYRHFCVSFAFVMLNMAYNLTLR